MGNEGQISVELRLNTDKVEADAKRGAERAAVIVNKTAGKLTDAKFDQNARLADKQSDASERLEQARKLRALRASNDAARYGSTVMGSNKAIASFVNPTIPKPKIPSSISAGDDSSGGTKYYRRFYGRLGYNAFPRYHPPVIMGSSGGGGSGVGIPPIIPPSAGGGGSMLSSGGGVLSIAARVGAVISGVAAAFYLLRRAINIASIPIRLFANEMHKAYESARSLYASRLKSGGMSAGFVSKRNVLADIIGVGQDEVMQYGKAVGFLNEKVSWGAKVFADANATLTAASWNIRVMFMNISAVMAKMAEAIAPAVNGLTTVISNFVKFAASTGVINFLVTSINDVLNGLSLAILGFETFRVGIQIIIDAIKMAFDQFDLIKARMEAKLTGTKGPAEHGAKWDYFASSKAMATEVAKHTFDFVKAHNDSAPAPAASANRMPASAWEKMGLVIGVGGHANPAKETARNTKEMIGYLRAIANHVAKGMMPGLPSVFQSQP